MSAQLDAFDQRLAQQSAAVPAHTREHIRAIAAALIASEQPFTITPTVEGYRSVYGELAQCEKDIVDRHGGALGSLGGRWSREGFPKCIGRAKVAKKASQAQDSRRYVMVWSGAR